MATEYVRKKNYRKKKKKKGRDGTGGKPEVSTCQRKTETGKKGQRALSTHFAQKIKYKKEVCAGPFTPREEKGLELGRTGT